MYHRMILTRFLRLLMEKLQLPVHCLVDCDPYGFEILATYRFGSMVRFCYRLENLIHCLCCLVEWVLTFHTDPCFYLLSFCKQMAYDIESLRAPEMKWLGAFPSDSEIYGVPQQCLLPLTEEGKIIKHLYLSLIHSFSETRQLSLTDKKRTEAMLLRCYLKREMPQWRYHQTSMSFLYSHIIQKHKTNTTWSFKGWNLKRCWKEEWSLRSKHSQFTHSRFYQKFTFLLKYVVREASIELYRSLQSPVQPFRYAHRILSLSKTPNEINQPLFYW